MESSNHKPLALLTTMLMLVFMQCSFKPERHTALQYPKPLPDSIPLPFLPGIVCSDSLDFNAAYSLDGKQFYFTRSRNGKYEILVTTYNGNEWTMPTRAPFSEPAYSIADPFITADGSIYFISNRPRNESDTVPDYDIWMVRPESDSTWSAPENIQAVNSDSTEYYVSLANNGNLYFASNREGTIGSHDIYVSKKVNGKYTEPENLGTAINAPEMEHDPLISPDERFIIFTSVGRSDSYGEADLYYSIKNEDNTWSPALNMGKQINTPTYEYCPYLTPDGKYFFYSTDYDVKWVRMEHLLLEGTREIL